MSCSEEEIHHFSLEELVFAGKLCLEQTLQNFGLGSHSRIPQNSVHWERFLYLCSSFWTNRVSLKNEGIYEGIFKKIGLKALTVLILKSRKQVSQLLRSVPGRYQ